MAEGKKTREFRDATLTHTQANQRKDAGTYTHSLLQHVFPDREMASEAGASGSEKALGLHNLQNHIEKDLENATTVHQANDDLVSAYSNGRIGPPEVIFDILSNVGTLIVEPDRLGISSHSNFSSIRANCCVYKGKWMYELFLGSKGVMQLGWCTINCKFSQEEGVGDTPDSYSYDGSRLRKWNVKTQKYGEPWLTGDVISCTIDCDNGLISFYRNGHSLGQAFSNVKLGPACAYFPAVSLSMSENVRANFGATPLRYPVDGFQPLQAPPSLDVVHAQLLFSYVEKLLPVMAEDDKQMQGAEFITGKREDPLPPLTEHRSQCCTSLLVASHVMEKLAPMLRSAYIVEACLLQFLLKICDTAGPTTEQPRIIKMLDIMWALMEEFEMKACMENLIISLLSSYRFSPVTPDFRHPKKYFRLMLAFLQHQRTRRYLISSVLFDKIKFPIFMHIKPPDDSGLAQIIPTVWWEWPNPAGEAPLPPETPEDREKRNSYQVSCDQLRQRIEEIEEIQVEMLKLLLTHTDLIEGKTTRVIFMEKFKSFLRENSGLMRIHQLNNCPLPVSLCFFHRLVRALRVYWDDFQKEDSARFVHSADAFVPIQEFWQDTRDYVDFQRCGGLMTHLNRTLGSEVNKAQGILLQDDGKVVKMDKKGKDSAAVQSTNEDYPEIEMPSGNSLMELLDGIVMLYHVAAHKQLGKMSSLRDSMKEFITALTDTDIKIKKCPHELKDVLDDLERAKLVFHDKITELARQMGWVIAVIYSPSKQCDVSWLLHVVLKTLEKASTYRKLFQYVPEFYIESCIGCFNVLSNCFHPTVSYENITDHPDLLRRYAHFLAMHFADPRIVSNDLRDNIVQALACFTCYPQTLKVLENLPMDVRIAMIRALVAPYENRSWAHTNWILVRFWKGCGFAFRYTYLPNLVPSKVQPTEFSFVSVQKPCPSRIFQSLMAKILLDDEPLATRFLDSLMNQLNWSFSEFVGIMQEIQQVVSRSDQLLEGRQLKICSACFEISVCLLRVLEMIVTIAPQIFTDWTRPSAELFLKRTMQLLSQVLTRITAKNGAFENIVNLPVPGLDSVTFFPILTVAVGILVQMIVRSRGTSQKRATQALMLDTGFNVKSLEFVLGDNMAERTRKDKSFSFAKFEEVSEEEVEEVKELLTYLRSQQEAMATLSPDVEEEDLCTICYVYPRSAVFKPCEHQSCRSCITQQLMSKKECFFCKAIITAVHDLRGRPILREQLQGQGHSRP